MPDHAQDERTSTIVRWVIATVLLVAIVMFVDAEAIVSTAKQANPIWIAAALALLPVNLILEAVKWRVLLSQSVERVSFREAMGSVLAGYALGFVTPARFGDYAGRVFYLPSRQKGVLFVMAALDRMYSVWIYTLAGTIILGFQLEGSLPGPDGVWWFTFILGVALTLILSIFIFRPSTLHTISSSLLRFRSTRTWIRHLQAVRKITLSTRVSVLLLSVARYAVFCSQFVLIVLAFDPAGSIPTLFAGVALVFFAKTVIPSISIFDLGIRESASVFFLGFFGVASAAAFNASLILFAVNLALPALVGIPFVPRFRWTKRRGASADSAAVQARTG